MQKLPETLHWHAANDNTASEEPPSIIPARTILCTNNDGDVAVIAAASGISFGDTALVNTGQLEDLLANFTVDHQAANCLIDLVPDDFKSTIGWAALIPHPKIPLFKQAAVIDLLNDARRIAITALAQHRASTGALIGSLGFTASRVCQHVSTSVLDFSTKLYVRAPLPVIGIRANDQH